MKINELTSDEFCFFTNSVAWGAPPLEQVNIAIENSLLTVLVQYHERPIGMGRVCGDKSLSFYIKDVVVVPEFQGQGIGTLILNTMLAHIKENILDGWKVSIELMASKEAENLYTNLGFEKRPTTEDGSGMFLMIEK